MGNLKQKKENVFHTQFVKIFSKSRDTYFLGKSTNRGTARITIKSNIISLYISCPTSDSQHYKNKSG